jgi:hypothetical protein
MLLSDKLTIVKSIVANPVTDPAKQRIAQVYLTDITQALRELKSLQHQAETLQSQVDMLTVENLKLKTIKKPRTKTTRTKTSNDTSSSS